MSRTSGPIIMPTRFLLSLLALVLATSGCENIAQTSDAERRIASEQVVIKAYSNEVPKVDALLATFLAAWKTANEKKELKAYKEDLEANVLPALDKFVAASEAMPLGSTQLRASMRTTRCVSRRGRPFSITASSSAN